MLTKQYSDRVPVQLLSSWLQLPRSTFYYKAHAGQRGMKVSTHTLFNESLVTNDQVVEKIRELISGPYNAYGYMSITDDLKARLDRADSDTYICLEVEQENRQVIHILNSDSVQLIGG